MTWQIPTTSYSSISSNKTKCVASSVSDIWRTIRTEGRTPSQMFPHHIHLIRILSRSCCNHIDTVILLLSCLVVNRNKIHEINAKCCIHKYRKYDKYRRYNTWTLSKACLGHPLAFVSCCKCHWMDYRGVKEENDDLYIRHLAERISFAFQND